jgi:hypothetical protein
MTDSNNNNYLLVIIYIIKNSVIAYSKSVVLYPNEFFTSSRSGIFSKGEDFIT